MGTRRGYAAPGICCLKSGFYVLFGRALEATAGAAATVLAVLHGTGSESFKFFIAHAPDPFGKSHRATAPALPMPATAKEAKQGADDQEEKEHAEQEERHQKCQRAKKHTEYDRFKNGLIHLYKNDLSVKSVSCSNQWLLNRYLPPPQLLI